MTAATIAALALDQRAPSSRRSCPAASRYQAVTASRWPMRWQRSSAWSCIAGVHSSSRKATFEARVSVMPCAATRVAQTISCGPVGVLERAARPPRAPSIVSRAEQVRGVAGSARAPPPAPRRGGRRRRAARRRRGSRGSTPARRGACRARPAAAASPSCARRSARSVAAIFASSSRQVERLLAQPRDHVAARPGGTRARCRARPARRPGAWPGSCGSTSRFSRRTKQRRRRCQCRRSSRQRRPGTGARSARREPKSSSRPMHAQLGDRAPRRG